MIKDHMNIIIGFVLMYVMFSFFPGVRIKYHSLFEADIMRYLDYFIRNLFHLWKIKLGFSAAAVVISLMIKRRKYKKCN